MAFKTAKQYNEDRYGGMFLLRQDGDYKDVVILYPDENAVLVADTHYIKSADYTGYVHCCGRGCPACAKGIRVQPKLFIPLYVISENEIQFWDRSVRFESQLQQEVFMNYPNPSDYVFRITRHGAAGDINTTYEIRVIGNNKDTPYDTILSMKGVTFPAHFNTICRDLSAGDLNRVLNSSASANPSSGYSSELPDYQITPRNSSVSQPSIPDTPPAVSSSVDVPEFTENSDSGYAELEDGEDVVF